MEVSNQARPCKRPRERNNEERGADLQQVQLASRSLISFQTPLQERLLYVQIRILAFVDESDRTPKGLGEKAKVDGEERERKEVNWNICIGRSTLACSCRARSSCVSSSTNPLLRWRRRHTTTTTPFRYRQQEEKHKGHSARQVTHILSKRKVGG
jgi:hypothetical protein